MRKDQVAAAGQLYIKNLIAEGEHQQLDFKFAINDSRKIARSLVAFANTEGGKLLVGVKDNGAIAGVRSEEEYYMIEAAAQMYCKPMVPFKVNKWMVDGKTVLEIDVKKLTTPTFAKDETDKWMAYVRVKDQNILANRVLIEYWKRKTKPQGTFISYSEKEHILINHLSENTSISASKFSRLAKITQKEAEKVLINLLCLNVIDILLTEKGAVYSLISK
jgi:predicted HTH transcriptional regulator